MSERSARGLVEFVRQTLNEWIASGMTERDAVAQHRHDELPNLLAGARTEVMAVGAMQAPLRRVPAIPTAQPGPSLETQLMEMIEALANLELQLLAQENPGGYIATQRQVAESQVIPLIAEYYVPSAEGVVRATPFVGETIDLVEAIGGRDVFSGEELTAGQRALSGGLGILGLIPVAGRVFRGLSGGGRAILSRLGAVARRMRVASRTLRGQLGRFARFERHMRSLRRVVGAFARGLPVRSLDVMRLREYCEELLRFVRLGAEVTVQAVSRLGIELASFANQARRSTVRIVDHAGQLRIFRCAG